jgi:hypothetical protein
MEQVYNKNLWGTNNTKFYSGEGSHALEQVIPYVTIVKAFLESFDNSLSVCDLGCGDFNIGKQLVSYTQKYIGVDIVKDLIAYNIQNFKAENLEFCCLDIAKDNLPKADCAILRQVLQHLSNKEISAILENLHQYKYIILTEHLPEGDFEANKDIISGQGIRLKKKSGIHILKAPFNFKVKRQTELLTIPNKQFGGVVVTWLFEL